MKEHNALLRKCIFNNTLYSLHHTLESEIIVESRDTSDDNCNGHMFYYRQFDFNGVLTWNIRLENLSKVKIVNDSYLNLISSIKAVMVRTQ